tara:strand:- start:23287 stop:24915 length:1629 start_codon:yes stop_codon:yes gene_type:complete
MESEIFEPAILLITLTCGLAMNRVGIPPLIGYLAAGFILFALDFNESNLPLLTDIANIGVYLLLFVIGLKLDLTNLLKPYVWATASLHMVLFSIVSVSLFKSLTYLGVIHLDTLTAEHLLLLAFAISFSSTVFVMKTLEARGELESRYGQIAIGILIIQDLFAVMFLTFSKGELPSIYALGLLALPVIRPLFYRACDHLGHGDLLVLFGLVMTLIFGAYLFELAGLKPDLGALMMGLLLSKHPKASEIASSLFYFKELFLVSFFVTIGLKGLPTWNDLWLALTLILFLPLKGMLFAILLTRFLLRARTAFLSSLSLMNYSEFGLIVTAVAISQGLLPDHLIITLALTLSLSFLIAAPLNLHSEHIYKYIHKYIVPFERIDANQEDKPIDIGEPRFLILGMGRIGTEAYNELRKHFGNVIVGIDHKPETVEVHQQQDRVVVLGDATDTDFWSKLNPAKHVYHILLCMPHHQANILALEQIQASSYSGKFSSMSYYHDERELLEQSGVDYTYSIYEAAGIGLARDIIKSSRKDLQTKILRDFKD